jgi:hypothetical protein
VGLLLIGMRYAFAISLGGFLFFLELCKTRSKRAEKVTSGGE